MALPLVARYPDKPLIEEEAPKPTRAPQRFVAPQLIKIPRRFMRNPVLAAETLGADGLVRFVTPENSFRILRHIRIIYTSSAAIGARTISVQIQPDGGTGTANASSAIRAILGLAGAAGAQSSAHIGIVGENVQSDGDGANIDTFQLNEPLPLPEGWAVEVDDTADISAADTVLMRGSIEEFALPRGLARGEIPMGLESGFMWDLTEPRRVA